MITVPFWLGVMFGGFIATIIMCLVSIDAYSKGWHDGVKHNE